MTWYHILRSFIVAGAATAVIALATGARAEGGEASIVPIDEVHEAVPAAPEPAEPQIEAAAAPGDAKPAKPGPRSRSAAGRAKGKAPAASAPASGAAPAEAQTAAVEAETPVQSVPAGAAAARDDASEAAAGAAGHDDAPASRRSRRLGSEARDAVRAAALRALVEHHAAEAGVPFGLADAVIRIESRYSAGARNGPHMGLTQINARTARSLGYAGDAAGLLDPATNLRYGLKYLARAYELARGDTCGTILRYQAGLRAQSMTRAARVYCVRVQTIIASAQ